MYIFKWEANNGSMTMTQASTNKHNFFAVTNLQHFLSAVYNTSEYKLNRGAHKEFTTQIYKPKQLTDSFKTIGSKCDTDQEYLALTKRFITWANEIDTYTWFTTAQYNSMK